MNLKRICIVPEYPLGLMTGGLQVQAEGTFKALCAAGVDAEMLEWSSPSPVADLYHFVGFPPPMASIAGLVRAAGKPYVCTVLFGGVRSPLQMTVARIRRAAKAAFFGQREYHRALADAAAVVAVNEAEGLAARRIFGLPIGKVAVIGHGVDNAFAGAKPDEWQSKYGGNPFILSVGAVQPRKNQLHLVQAANMAGLPLVLIGPVLPGEEAYAGQVAEAMKRNAAYGGAWVPGLAAQDSLLKSAYAACRMFALVSHCESQPIAVMEAMAARKPVLLGDAGYAQEPPFEHLARTSGTRIESAARALRTVWETGQASLLPSRYLWGEVARALSGVYARILNVRAGEDMR